MARVTVEDCLKHVDNRFDLVIKAAKRAHLLELGAADPTVPLENDKPTVVALREIAAGHDITKTRVSTAEEAEKESEAEKTADAGTPPEASSSSTESSAIQKTEDVVRGADD